MKISIPNRLWYENQEMELILPDRWDVDNLNPPGFDKPGLGSEEIKKKVDHPVKGPTIKELAAGKKQAVIVFDDMTRPTPVREVAPHVLNALHRAGMGKEQIRFIWSLGSHGTYDMINARKKLGDKIVENYAVYNHDPFQNTVSAGRTSTGVELWFNREFMACDLKIGIGCITPHVHVGFGGGAKIIFPGVAGIESINQFHNQFYRKPGSTGLGKFENNIMRAEVDAAGTAAGLNFKIDCMINRRGQVTNLYSGPFRDTHAAGAFEGKSHYGTPHTTGYDIAICNTYAKANESAIALLVALELLIPGNGTAVIISDAPEGQVPHYVMRSWGSNYGGRHFSPKQKDSFSGLVKKLIVMTPYPDRTFMDWACHIDDVVVVKTWPEVLAILDKNFPDKAKVAVVQDGTMQYLLPREDNR